MKYKPIKLLLGSGRSTLRRFSFHRTAATKHKLKIQLETAPQNSNNKLVEPNPKESHTQPEEPPPEHLVDPVVPTTASVLRCGGQIPAPVEEVAATRRDWRLHLLSARPIWTRKFTQATGRSQSAMRERQPTPMDSHALLTLEKLELLAEAKDLALPVLGLRGRNAEGGRVLAGRRCGQANCTLRFQWFRGGGDARAAALPGRRL
jgi:hypothetical protein